MSSSSSHPASSPSQPIGSPADREDKLFKTSKSDIVLRAPPPSDSKDRGFVLFPFRSIVLRAASPVFDDILDIPQPPGAMFTPFINLSEDADSLRLFLVYLNPTTTRPSYFLGLQVTKSLFSLACKYQVDWLSHEMERKLSELASSHASVELWEFCFDNQLGKVLFVVMISFRTTTPASFPRPLRRKMGDDLWDTMVEVYLQQGLCWNIPATRALLKGAGFDWENWRFSPKEAPLPLRGLS